MNYYHYQPRQPRKRRGADYLKPFIIILVFAGILVAGWKLATTLLSNGSPTESSEKVMVQIESGSAKAMTSAGGDWKNIPSNIPLYEGEKIKTQSDGRLALSFFDGSTARLDRSSELAFKSLSQEGDSALIDLALAEGNLWVDTSMSETLVGTFLVSAEQFRVTSDLPAVFSVAAPDKLYVLKGRVSVDILENTKPIKTISVGVGQQLVLTPSIVADLSQGLDKELLFALSDAFKTSNWYRWNQQKDGLLSGESDLSDSTDINAESESEAGTQVEPESESPSDVSSEADADEKNPEDPLTENDKVAPTKPMITEPGSNDETVTLKSAAVDLKGTVSKDTEVVIVNDYRLGKFVPGSGTFRYTANVTFGNLKLGDNKFEVVALDKAGNKSETAIITLVLPQAVLDEAKVEESVESETAVSTGTGEVKITSPNGGENLVTTETAFEIAGQVPATTAKVLVNDYQLQAFEAGDTSFKFNAKSALGTLKVGANSYTVKAYDKDDKLIGSDAINIEVQSTQGQAETEASSALSLSIDYPGTSGVYATTLTPLVIGGKVSQSVEAVYVNGSKLADYSVGSGEWKMTVDLKEGENNFSAYGEKGTEKTTTSNLKVTYTCGVDCTPSE